jgi:hypothetical protein
MKKIIKYLVTTGLTAVICIICIKPADAQHGGGHMGGGGGHFGGGGGGHFGGSGGFSGARSGGGFSGARTMASPQHFSGGSRGSFAPRSNFYTGGRAGIRRNTGSFAGRSYAGYGHGYYNHGAYGHGGYGHGVYGRPYSWGRHGGYFYRHGYYGSLYYPYLGLDFGYLPYGYYPFDWGDEEYYFSNGLYYQSNADNQYTVVEPPVGAAVNTLPSDAQSIVIDGQQYYELNGVYYSPITKDDGTAAYQIAGKDGELNTTSDGTATVVPKVGDIVTQLPPDCRKINLTGQTFYVSEDGIYYQETTDGNHQKAYKIVALESDQEGN